MKTKTLILVGVLIIALAAMAAPVMAATDAPTAVYGTIQKTVSITASNTEQTIVLTPGSTTQATGVTLNANENCAGYIQAVDDYAANTKDEATAGYMTNYTGSAYSAVPVGALTKLSAKIALAGTTTGVFTQAAQATDLATAKQVYTFTTTGTEAALPLTFSQAVHATNDVTLPGSNSYRIPIKFSIACV
jgi:hypothetical protein